LRECSEIGWRTRRKGFDPRGIETDVVVDKNIAKATEPSQTISQGFVNHSLDVKLGDDVFVVFRTHSEMGAQNVIADIQNDFRAELKTALESPTVPLLRSAQDIVGLQSLQAGDHFLELEQPTTQRIRT
jgi:hypothetical protein